MFYVLYLSSLYEMLFPTKINNRIFFCNLTGQKHTQTDIDTQ